jgi:hypothetical protein
VRMVARAHGGKDASMGAMLTLRSMKRWGTPSCWPGQPPSPDGQSERQDPATLPSLQQATATTDLRYAMERGADWAAAPHSPARFCRGKVSSTLPGGGSRPGGDRSSTTGSFPRPLTPGGACVRQAGSAARKLAHLWWWTV